VEREMERKMRKRLIVGERVERELDRGETHTQK
jgi:hypothetical protein